MGAKRGPPGWLIVAAIFGGLWLVAKGKAPESPSASKQTAVVQPSAKIEQPKPTTSAPTPEITAATPAIEEPNIEAPSPSAAVEPIIWAYTTARVRLRSKPSTSSTIIATLGVGERLQLKGRNGDWHEVNYSGGVGWVHGRYVASDTPTPPPSSVDASPPAAFTTIVPKVEKKPSRRGGEPIREAYAGRCDCPYDQMRNGRACGGRSAWSKPGGRNPVCFVGE